MSRYDQDNFVDFSQLNANVRRVRDKYDMLTLCIPARKVN